MDIIHFFLITLGQKRKFIFLHQFYNQVSGRGSIFLNKFRYNIGRYHNISHSAEYFFN